MFIMLFAGDHILASSWLLCSHIGVLERPYTAPCEFIVRFGTINFKKKHNSFFN